MKPTVILSQDVGGISPEPEGAFVKGRKQVNWTMDFRYEQNLSTSFGYTWFWGGGAYDVLAERDFAQASVTYLF